MQCLGKLGVQAASVLTCGAMAASAQGVAAVLHVACDVQQNKMQ